MIEMILAGFLFLFIIITLVIGERFGYSVISDLDSETKLQEINKDPKKFKIGTVLALIEHGTIIALAITLFLAFNSFNITLAVIWAISRITEGSINYNEKNKTCFAKVKRVFCQSLEHKGLSILNSKNRWIKTFFYSWLTSLFIFCN